MQPAANAAVALARLLAPLDLLLESNACFSHWEVFQSALPGLPGPGLNRGTAARMGQRGSLQSQDAIDDQGGNSDGVEKCWTQGEVWLQGWDRVSKDAGLR